MYVLLSFTFIFLSFILYSVLFRLFLEAYNTARRGIYLIEILYVPSLIVITGISASFVSSFCGFATKCNIYKQFKKLLRAYMPILIVGGIGAVLGLPLKSASPLAVRLFVINLFIAAIYIILVLYLFVVSLPIALAKGIGISNGKIKLITYWILATIFSGWSLLPVRLAVAKMFPSLNNYILYKPLSDPFLDEILRKHLLRYIDVVLFFIFVVLSSYVYYFFLDKRIQKQY